MTLRETWRSFIRNRAAVLNLPSDVQAAVREGLDYRKAMIIGRVKDPGQRLTLLERTHTGITVQELRALVSGTSVGSADPTDADTWTTVAKQLMDARRRSTLTEVKRNRVEKLLHQLASILAE